MKKITKISLKYVHSSSIIMWNNGTQMNNKFNSSCCNARIALPPTVGCRHSFREMVFDVLLQICSLNIEPTFSTINNLAYQPTFVLQLAFSGSSPTVVGFSGVGRSFQWGVGRGLKY